jgi:hypothetical protein
LAYRTIPLRPEKATGSISLRALLPRTRRSLGLRHPPTADSNQVRILARRIVEQPQASVSDTSTLVAPLAPSDDAYFSGGLLGRLAVLAGIDPRGPTQLAPPPLDDQLRGFYRDDPMQPWFVRRQR